MSSVPPPVVWLPLFEIAEHVAARLKIRRGRARALVIEMLASGKVVARGDTPHPEQLHIETDYRRFRAGMPVGRPLVDRSHEIEIRAEFFRGGVFSWGENELYASGTGIAHVRARWSDFVDALSLSDEAPPPSAATPRPVVPIAAAAEVAPQPALPIAAIDLQPLSKDEAILQVLTARKVPGSKAYPNGMFEAEVRRLCHAAEDDRGYSIRQLNRDYERLKAGLAGGKRKRTIVRPLGG